jgi:hypothetical protein
MTRIAVSVALAAALAACSGAHEAQTHATPPEARTSMPQDSLALRRLSADAETGFRHNSRMEAAVREVVRDAGAWSRLWPRLSGSMGGASPAPRVDFDREMALVAAMGRRSTGGFEVRIESVERTGAGLVAHVVETSPGPTCGTGAALSSPADVVLVPRSDLPVRWEVRRAVTDCG